VKRDPDLLRAILLEVEIWPYGEIRRGDEIHFEGYELRAIVGHAGRVAPGCLTSSGLSETILIHSVECSPGQPCVT
jgi:hypothetical protein